MEQVERTRRYLKRMRDIYNAVPYLPDSRDYYLDDVHSFFVHCYHVRDWILHLNRLGLEAAAIDHFINAHEELRICADLCNGAKHCEREQRPKTGRQPHIAQWSFISNASNDDMRTTRGKFTILSNGRPFDALELAERCMALWDGFIADLAHISK